MSWLSTSRFPPTVSEGSAAVNVADTDGVTDEVAEGVVESSVEFADAETKVLKVLAALEDASTDEVLDTEAYLTMLVLNQIGRFY